MRGAWPNGMQIEVVKRRHRQARLSAPTELLCAADFVFDMTTFTVVKNRWGNVGVSPLEGCLMLGDALNDPHARILLLTD